MACFVTALHTLIALAIGFAALTAAGAMAKSLSSNLDYDPAPRGVRATPRAAM